MDRLTTPSTMIPTLRWNSLILTEAHTDDTEFWTSILIYHAVYFVCGKVCFRLNVYMKYILTIYRVKLQYNRLLFQMRVQNVVKVVKLLSITVPLSYSCFMSGWQCSFHLLLSAPSMLWLSQSCYKYHIILLQSPGDLQTLYNLIAKPRWLFKKFIRKKENNALVLQSYHKHCSI